MKAPSGANYTRAAYENVTLMPSAGMHKPQGFFFVVLFVFILSFVRLQNKNDDADIFHAMPHCAGNRPEQK